MARKRSRIEGLRMPFVVTAALGAAACGGTVVDHGAREGTNGSGGGTAETGGGGPAGTGGGNETGGLGDVPIATTLCPVAAPGGGTWCNYAGPPCSYGGCADATTATCQNFVWTVSFTPCNPPAPPYNPHLCPLGVPTNGQYCAYTGPGCDYGYTACGTPSVSATCNGNSWSVSNFINDCDGGLGFVDSGPLPPQ